MSVDELIYVNLTGQASPQEREQLTQWLQEDEANARIFAELKDHWQGEKRKVKRMQKEAWLNLQEAILTQESPKSSASTMESTYLKGRVEETKKIPLWRMAAAVVAFMIAGAAIFWSIGDHVEVSTEFAEVEPVMIAKVNPKGRKSNFSLPDGTQVKLNSSSKLSFAEDFGSNNMRKVTLEGEAFFDVVENPERPFVVQTGNVSTVVKGTSFNVNAFPAHNTVQIAVVTGLVDVKNQQDSVRLKPGEMAVSSLQNARDSLLKQWYDEDVLAWTTGTLIFKKASIGEIENTLEFWYGYEIAFKRDIAIGGGFTGRYHRESLEGILESMSFALDFKFKIDKENGRVTIW